ncbi:hypothetical protein RFI_27957 [Reticulomyxa filosa]|uniref:Phosphoglycerate mutase family protein n=1 Tax=Reticulomyxa filosa TaxID=46433 RepID=X6M733_RETFI|nr:hypothetical protein RFI_27957 [Reticulomyxa filosa]|eukprot:ETO09421.1 hypothetical protein RFI_27957 [Reticulomyxa filosa]
MENQTQFLNLGWSATWFWTVLIATVLLLTHGGKKCYIVLLSFVCMITRKDKRRVLPSYDPGQIDMEKVLQKHKKRLILIRHGESTWNEIFNRRFDLSWPLRLFHAIARECLLFVTSDSVFADAPLSQYGMSQAKELQDYLFKGEMKDELKNDLLLLKNAPNKGALLVSSPLRRCVETLSLALFPRLNNSREEIVLVSHLQEVTSNVDGMSLSGYCEFPPLSITMRLHGPNKHQVKDWEEWLSSRLNVSHKESFKPSFARADDRMRAFVSWVFSNNCSEFDNVVLCGHSLWFRYFFEAYLPRNSIHTAKKNKIQNTGAIALDFIKCEMNDGSVRFRIEPDSIVVIHRGFETSSKH